jgi:transposase
MRRYGIRDDQWDRIRDLLPGREGTVGVTARDNRRSSRWAKSGVWERVFQHLAADADNEYAMIDSTIVRAHQHSAGAKKKTARTRRSDDREAD